MSVGHAPLVKELLSKRYDAETRLGISSGVALSVDDEEAAFYSWAESFLEKIEASSGDFPYKDSKLNLAWSLGILDEPRWLARETLPLRGNTPRHRAIARLAVEGRIHALVCLNWDCLLEAAFESIGLPRGKPNEMRPGKLKAYDVLIYDGDFSTTASTDRLRLLKPHGCVRDLQLAKELESAGKAAHKPVFRIAKTELEKVKDNSGIVEAIRFHLRGHPLVSAGWAISEPYLQAMIAELQAVSPSMQSDSIGVVDINWSEGHEKAAAAFGKAQNASYFQVQKAPTSPNTDSLFQWIFARYALRLIRTFAPASVVGSIEDLCEQFKTYQTSALATKWCDDFLPSWIRVCWRAGGVPYKLESGVVLQPFQLPTGPRDFHVPLDAGGGPNQVRPDLSSAAVLLAALEKAKHNWAFDLFPGALWNEDGKRLVIPVPGWIGTDKLNDLQGIQPLVEALRREGGIGNVNELRLLALGPDGEAAVSVSEKAMLEASVRRQMPQSKLAMSGTTDQCFLALSDL